MASMPERWAAAEAGPAERPLRSDLWVLEDKNQKTNQYVPSPVLGEKSNVPQTLMVTVKMKQTGAAWDAKKRIYQEGKGIVLINLN